MKKTTQSVERLQDMLKHGSRKRKRSESPDEESLPPAKRPRKMVAVVPLFPRTFLLKVKKWQDRKRKIELGMALYIEAQLKKMADTSSSPPEPTVSLSVEALEGIKAAEQLIEEISAEIAASFPKRYGIIKRLEVNNVADNSVEVKVVPVKRRGGWRKKGEKRN
ncbi:uncharacterized protein LOC132727599 isoform X2 [Ruditapes philippinarum]|uniref:uncharacterized protein LOC132727599 isoform X1 n=1 Tax=Ruditapes philippinarum TaxID=129788 RepID=UPI00295A9114|nr:uncharacterized protein LOC132727599 isoform X1 [Ruditapes philippinarum]XP_060569141.1 uncharacterized protein LOC132727599 isoform X2 [Ruditapes philippinarum]